MLPQNTTNFLPGRLFVTNGNTADYRTLARFHYVPTRPATVAAVVTAIFVPDGTTGGSGPDSEPRTVGVAVLSWPSALNRTRHHVFGLKSVRFGERLKWVNANVRTVSRVIVHPQFRGLGLSGQLIHAICAQCPTPYVEAAARMGRAHPLFDRCGFTRVEPATVDEAIYYWRDEVKMRAIAKTFPDRPPASNPKPTPDAGV